MRKKMIEKMKIDCSNYNTLNQIIVQWLDEGHRCVQYKHPF